MKYFSIRILILLFSIASFSCNKKEQEEGKTPLAKVHDKYLYLEDIADMIPNDIPPKDSINKVKSFVDFWVKQRALTKTAELNLAEEQKDVSEELENYRMDLLIFRYKQKFLEQNLDTIVTNEQVNAFYEMHQAEFRLTQPAVKVRYIKILRTSPNLKMVKSLYRSKKEKYIQQVKDYCEESSSVYDEFNNNWMYFKDLLQEIPTQITEHEKYLKSKSYIEAKDSVYLYLVNINNHKLKGAIAPQIFVQENIQSMLLNKRKQELIDELQTNIYNNMLDKEEIVIFKSQQNKSGSEQKPQQ